MDVMLWPYVSVSSAERCSGTNSSSISYFSNLDKKLIGFKLRLHHTGNTAHFTSKQMSQSSFTIHLYYYSKVKILQSLSLFCD